MSAGLALDIGVVVTDDHAFRSLSGRVDAVLPADSEILRSAPPPRSRLSDTRAVERLSMHWAGEDR